VATLFIENPNRYTEVNHKDGDKLNNATENLEWVSRLQNMRHAYATGLAKVVYGERAPNAKLSDEDVRVIRETYRKRVRGRTLNDLAARFGCTAAHIQRIVTMQTRNNHDSIC
jgi:hypothetical protein